MRHRPTEYLSPAEWELLSAYIDGEVTDEEREHVQSRLFTESGYQSAYRQLLRLQDGLEALTDHTLERGSSSQQVSITSADDMADAVLLQLERSPLSGFMSGRTARQVTQVAAGIVLLVSAGGMLLRSHWMPRPHLMISVEEPPLEIPKVTVTPELTSTRKAQSYLLSPRATDDPYSILLSDS